MGQRQVMAEIGKLAIVPRPQDQVPVIRHQAIRQQTHAGNMLQRIGQHALERVVIASLLENGQAAIGPVQDVINVTPNTTRRGLPISEM